MSLNHNVRSEDFESTVDAESLNLGVERPEISSFSSTCLATQAQESPFSPPFPSGLNLNLNLAPGFEQPSGWISPPPAWTPNRSPWTDLDSLSSSASTGVYQDPNWDPFEHSLSAVNSTINDGAFVSRNPFPPGPSNLNPYQNGHSNPDDSSFVSLSSMNRQPTDPAHFDYDLETRGDEDPRLRQLMYRSKYPLISPLPSPGLPSQPQTRTRQPAWGQPRSRGSSSSTSSRSHHQKRRKSIDQTDQTARLRSTSFGTYRTGNSASFSTMNPKGEGSKTRSNHNQIEKQYRNRLNSQFEVLLAALPKEEVLPYGREVVGDDVEESVGRQGVEARKVSKAEVLDIAQKHTQRLEREGEELEAENEELGNRVLELNRIWVEGGGVVMP